VDVITLSDEEEIIGETKHSYWSAFDKKKIIKTCSMFSQPIERYQTKTNDNAANAKNVKKLHMMVVWEP